MQTSIEWLVEQLIEMDKQLDGRRKNEDATILKMNPTKIFEQAKQMEKDEERQKLIGLLDWMNKVAADNPMALETDHDDIVDMYIKELDLTDSKNKQK